MKDEEKIGQEQKVEDPASQLQDHGLSGKSMPEQPDGPEKNDFKKHYHFLQSVIDGVAEPLMVVGLDFQIKLMNRAANDFSTTRESSAADLTCHRLFFNLDRPCDFHGYPCPIKIIRETGQPFTVERKLQLPDGGRRIFEILASPLYDENGGLQGIIESARDITERKKFAELLELRVRDRAADLLSANTALLGQIKDRQRAEDELRQAKEQAELLCSVIPSAVFTVDLEQRLTSMNKKAEEITGYKAAELIGKKCGQFAKEPCGKMCGLLSDRIKKPIIGVECKIMTKGGVLKTVTKNADFLRDPDGRVIGGIESFEDIDGRIQVERVLRSERDKFRSMLAALGQGMHILNRDFIIEHQNEILRCHFGDRLGQKCYHVYKQQDKPCEICRMQAAIKTNEIQRTELLMANGHHYEQSYAPFTDVDGQPKVMILLRDITDEKVFQAETMRAGQLASIGELAAGVAHEINNPINGIINYTQLLLDEIEGGAATLVGCEPHTEVLKRVIREGERIAEIVSKLLSFARRRGDEEEEEVYIDTVINDSLSLIKHQLLKDGIILAVELADGLPPVQANAQQLQQVFLNLLSNARYALNHRYPGKEPHKRLEIRSQIAELPGRTFVRTTFTDWGTGIPEDIIDNIFEPFFSTKQPGEGTGLGLSISHKLIKDSHGFLHVKSKPGHSTTMTVDLPILMPDDNPAGRDDPGTNY